MDSISVLFGVASGGAAGMLDALLLLVPLAASLLLARHRGIRERSARNPQPEAASAKAQPQGCAPADEGMPQCSNSAA